MLAMSVGKDEDGVGVEINHFLQNSYNDYIDMLLVPRKHNH
jgi:hypothetical protein